MIDFLFNLDVEGLFFLNNLAQSSQIINKLSFYLAKWGALFFIVLILLLWFKKSKKRKILLNHQVISITVLSFVVSLLIDQFISILINRTRPFIVYPEIHTLPLNYDLTSFPSSHTLYLIAVSFSIYLLGYKKYGFFLILFSTLIGIARIAGGAHYPSDILSAILLGGIIAYIIANKNSIIRKQFTKN